MKTSKKFIAVFATVLVFTAISVTAFAAATYDTPAQAVAGITGKTMAEVAAERQDGKSYGAIAAEAGKLDEFQVATLEMKKANLAAKVAAGSLTQTQADKILANCKQQQTICDGTGNIKNNCDNGNGRGKGKNCQAQQDCQVRQDCQARQDCQVRQDCQANQGRNNGHHN